MLRLRSGIGDLGENKMNKTEKINHKLLSEDDVREFLGLNRNMTHNLMLSSSFPSFGIGRKLFVDADKFEQWYQDMENKAFKIEYGNKKEAFVWRSK